MAGAYNPNLDVETLEEKTREIEVDTDIVRATLALKDAALVLTGHAKDTLSVAEAFVQKTVRESPYLTLGAAAGAGFVVGGGLGAPITRKAINMTWKAGSAFLLDAALKTLGVVTPARPADEATPDDSNSNSNNNGETP